LRLEKRDLTHSDFRWAASPERKFYGNLNDAVAELSDNSDLNLSNQWVVAKSFDREIHLSAPLSKAGAQLVSQPTAPGEQYWRSTAHGHAIANLQYIIGFHREASKAASLAAKGAPIPRGFGKNSGRPG
jgi:hypothetical protein